jgi:hypothetical protein
MDLTSVQTQTNQLLQIIVGGALSIAIIYTTKYVNKLIEITKKKAQNIDDEGTRNLVTNALNDVDTLLQNNIISAENTLKPQILNSIADGKVDKSELSSLAETVKTNVLAQLGTQSIEVLNNNLGDLNSYVSTRLEKVLCDLKDSNSTAVTKTVIPKGSALSNEASQNSANTEDIKVEDMTNNTEEIKIDNSASSKIVVDNPENTIEDGKNVIVTEATTPTI